MKLVFYDDFKLGVMRGDSVVDASTMAQSIVHTSPQDLLNRLIAGFSQYKSQLQQIAQSGTVVPQARLRSPVPKPYDIVAMAVNYMEDGTRSAPAPINAFHKSPHSVVGDGDTIILPDVPATIFEHEAELAIVIGKHASNVKAADAYDYIFGYTNFIDVSARGLKPDGNTFFQMKSRDTFAPIGPWLVTADEVADPLQLQVRLWVNGILKQNFNTSDMAHKIPRVIEWATSIHDLEPGDVIATGTNHRGLSALQDGDSVEMEITGMGRIHLKVRDDLKRTWGRETRLEMEQKGLSGTTPQLTGKYAKA
jgi:2-keto-4-pentenoate hydratase/2-oxohepta-3-ene-1,7-dioic acid hydratase in catechol pathway